MKSFKEFLKERTITSKKSNLKDDPRIIEYVRFKEYQELKKALEEGANPDFINASHNTALLIACREESYHLVELLLQYGANPNLSAGASESHSLLVPDSKEIIELLLEHGADINKPNKYQFTFAMKVARDHRHDLHDLLKKYRADLTAKNNTNETAIDLAKRHNNQKFLKDFNG